MNKTYLTPSECANQVRVTLNTVIRWINKGYRTKKLYAQRAGRKWLVNPETWRKFLYETGQTK